MVKFNVTISDRLKIMGVLLIKGKYMQIMSFLTKLIFTVLKKCLIPNQKAKNKLLTTYPDLKFERK